MNIRKGVFLLGPAESHLIVIDGSMRLWATPLSRMFRSCRQLGPMAAECQCLWWQLHARATATSRKTGIRIGATLGAAGTERNEEDGFFWSHFYENAVSSKRIGAHETNDQDGGSRNQGELPGLKRTGRLLVAAFLRGIFLCSYSRCEAAFKRDWPNPSTI